MNASTTSDAKGARSTGSGRSAESPSSVVPETEHRPAPGWTPSQFKPNDYASMHALRNEVSHTSASATNKARDIREYTLGEEIANSVTHGLGALLAIAAIPILVVRALDDGGGIYLFAALVYTLTMLLEYTMSTLYHAIAVDRAKRVFKVLDHSCIYLFIAGSYTPFCLILACRFRRRVAVRLRVAGCVGGRCLRGVLGVSSALGVGRAVSSHGLVRHLVPPRAHRGHSRPGLWLLVGGGICYSIGCIFYVLKKVPYMHSLFHLWVLAGSVLQFLAIFLYVM